MCEQGISESADCVLVGKLWSFIWNSKSGDYYLPNIIKNGLRAEGFSIPPFSTIDVGDIPKITMFDKKPWGSVAISMSHTTLSGLDTASKGSLACKTSDGDTTVTLSINFGDLLYRGGYEVSSSGLAGCAIGTAYNYLHFLQEAVAGSDNDLDLARWYRDDTEHGLPSSENGRLLLGAYYLHQDTIQSLMTSSVNPFTPNFKSNLGSKATGKTAGAVQTATHYYKGQNTQSALEKAITADDPAEAAPTIGSIGQYTGGFTDAVYLTLAAHWAKENALSEAEENEYESLLNSMANFRCAVLYVQNQTGKPVTTAEVLDHVKNAPLGALQCDDPMPIYDPETGEIIESIYPQPLDRERLLEAYEARGVPEKKFDYHGSFNDQGQSVTATLSVEFKTVNSKLNATAKSAKIKIGDLHITLNDWSGPDSLFNKVNDWIANTGFFQDTLKSKLNGALNSSKVLGDISDALNAGLRKLGT